MTRPAVRAVLFSALLALLGLPGVTLPAAAAPTEVVVRVLSKDAKFIGTSMGGVRITLRDVETGALLATGLTAGGTGNTAKTMHKDGGRRALMADASAARFATTLELDRPTLVEVEALGPQGQPQATTRVTARQWLVPGKSLNGGDGWVLELPGFVVDVLDPPAHGRWTAGQPVALKANVTMMCGCPIEPGGLWDASRYEVRALVRRDGQPAGEVSLAFAGATSQFAGSFTPPVPGSYELTVYAYDPATGNTGLDRTTLVVAGQ
ncbi:hypothetical protein [Parapedomonas caeni]